MLPLLSPQRCVCYAYAVMSHRFRITPFEVALVACTALLAVLVYDEGWIWPLKAAAVIIPVSLLIG